MRLPRPAGSNYPIVFLAVLSFLDPGIVTASPNPTKQEGHLVPQSNSYVYPMGFKVLSPTGGVDFIPYLQTLVNSCSRSFHAKIPQSAATGEKGVVVIQVHIQKDGSVPDNSVMIASSSGKDQVDAAALSVMRAAAPFAHLPEGFSGTYIDLQVRFYFGSTPREPEQKPKIVPVQPAVDPAV